MDKAIELKDGWNIKCIVAYVVNSKKQEEELTEEIDKEIYDLIYLAIDRFLAKNKQKYKSKECFFSDKKLYRIEMYEISEEYNQLIKENFPGIGAAVCDTTDKKRQKKYKEWDEFMEKWTKANDLASNFMDKITFV